MLDYRKLTRNGQLTLPSWFREKYHLETGELIELIEQKDGLLIRPLKPIKKTSAVQELIQILNTAGDKIEELKEEEVLKLVEQELKAIRKKNETNH